MIVLIEYCLWIKLHKQDMLQGKDITKNVQGRQPRYRPCCTHTRRLPDPVYDTRQNQTPRCEGTIHTSQPSHHNFFPISKIVDGTIYRLIETFSRALGKRLLLKELSCSGTCQGNLLVKGSPCTPPKLQHVCLRHMSLVSRPRGLLKKPPGARKTFMGPKGFEPLIPAV
jgi:hypothetical protein